MQKNVKDSFFVPKAKNVVTNLKPGVQAFNPNNISEFKPKGFMTINAMPFNRGNYIT